MGDEEFGSENHLHSPYNDNTIHIHSSQSKPMTMFMATDNVNGIMPLQLPDYNFQEGQSKCGIMESKELKSEVLTDNGGMPWTENFVNVEQGHHDNGVPGHYVEASKYEDPSNTIYMKEHVTEDQEMIQQSGLALWVKWRGKWQAGLQCSMNDCPSATLKAMPTYGRKTYIVVYFPTSRSHCWTDSQLACAISEKPEPLAFGTHESGQELVKDLSIPRRYMLQKLAVAMLEASDQLHVEAVVESARNVNFWKEFAKEVAQCTVYCDLGRMLLKLHSMILGVYISPLWMKTFDLWKQHCESTKTAECTEKLTKDLVDAILWEDVGNLWNAPVQTALGEEWKTWKKEAMKLFPISNPSTSSFFERNFDKESREEYIRISDTLDSNNFEASRKRQKLEIRRGNSSEVREINDSQFMTPGDMIYSPFSSHTGECQLVPYTGHSKATMEEVDLKNQSSAENVHRARHDESLTLTVKTDHNFLICQGMTKYGRRCSHRTRNGTSFCLKHTLKDSDNLDESVGTPNSNTLGNSQKRDRVSVEGCPSEKEQTPADVFQKESQIKQSSPPFSDLETVHGSMSLKMGDEICAGARHQSQNVSVPERSAAKVSNRSANWSRCIGSCRNHGGQCSHRAKRGSSYCEKHLPSSMGLHHRYTASMLNDIFKNTNNEELYCEKPLKDLLEECMKLCLSDGGNYDLDSENRGLDWIIGEVSKNMSDAEALLKEVSAEKQKLAAHFGFEEREDNGILSSPGMSEGQKPLGSGAAVGNVIAKLGPLDGMDDSETFHHLTANEAQNQKCNGCSEEFSDVHALSHHCLTIHKKAAEWHFRGYACRNCSSSFTNKKGLERHVKIHHNGVSLEQCTQYICISCGSHFMDCDQLWQHVLHAHPEELNQSTCIKEQVNSTESSKPLKVEQDKQDPVVLSSSKQDISCEFASEHKIESNHSSMSTFHEDTGIGENRTFVRDTMKRFSCRFCGMRFSLLPDLGRHHQAQHMGSSSGYKPHHKRGKEIFTWRANNANLRTIQTSAGLQHAAVIASKKRFKKNDLQRSIGVDNRVQQHNNQSEVHDIFTESYLSAVVEMLLSEGQKVRPLPNNLEILNVARLACCRDNLQAALEEKYGALSERLYIKAARLCSEENIRVEWHKEGFICSKGCKRTTDTEASVPLTPVLDVCLSPLTVQANHINIDTKETHTSGTWENVESHLVLNDSDVKISHQQKIVVLLDDLSFGREAVPIPCLMDEDVISKDGKDQYLDTLRPWESFTYITDRLLDSSLGLDAKSSQLGCTCTQPQCSPGSCDHVYLFENDNENARDIYGKSMIGRFPYDDKGQIILEKGYLVYECNSMCTCQKECPNRVLQRGVQVKLEVYKTKNKGWGVRAAEAITLGTFICEYIGEVLNDQEANKRGERYDKEGCSYLYDIDPHIDTNEFMELMEEPKPYVIDATKYGNVARFINHSCNPNLVNYQVLVESMDCQLAHIGLYASKDIATGEELAYDYNYKLLPGNGSLCHCGAENCRRRLY